MAHYWHIFLVILKEPFHHPDLIWGIVPLYFGWLLNELTSSKASFRTAIQTGVTFVWAAAQWFYQYAHRHSLPATAVITHVTLKVKKNGFIEYPTILTSTTGRL